MTLNGLLASGMRSNWWLNTGGMAAGWYRIGATYAPTSGPTTTAYAGGLLHIADEGRKSIVVSEPGSSTVLTVGADINVRFSASDPAGDSQVNVFYDRDRVFNGNETNVPPVLGEGDAAAVIPTAGLAPGLYFVGASLGNDPATRVAGYAPGAVLLRAVGAPPLGILTVLAPETDTTVLANTALNVTWFINRANPCPTVTIFYQDVDPAGRPIGTIDDKILARDVPADLSMMAVTIPESLASADPATAKYWLIGVKYACDTEPAAVEYAPGRFRVISNTAKFVAIERPTRNVVTTVPASRPSSQPTSAPAGSDIELTFVGIDPLGVSSMTRTASSAPATRSTRPTPPATAATWCTTRRRRRPSRLSMPSARTCSRVCTSSARRSARRRATASRPTRPRASSSVRRTPRRSSCSPLWRPPGPR